MLDLEQKAEYETKHPGARIVRIRENWANALMGGSKN